MKTLLALLLLTLAAGCAISRPWVKETVTATNGVVTTREMRLTAWAFWPATQNVDKQRGSIGKTLSLGAIGVEQETGGTNVVEALKSLDSILGKVRP